MKYNNSRSFTWFVYSLLWVVVWAYPLVAVLVRDAKGDIDFSWTPVLQAWIGILPFFLLFAVHHLAVMRFLMRRRFKSYAAVAVAAITLFCFYSYSSEPPHRQSMPPRERQHAILPPKPPHHNGFPKPMALDFVIAVLMMGFDIAIALFSRYQEEQEKASRLESVHFQYELEHLKAQINPHFFMNMLNNIHGLVEIDPERAQEMIMELSKMMRYVLYEGDKQFIPTLKEAQFVANYVTLMKKRYSPDKVKVTLNIDEARMQGSMVPPLLFITLIENAFKHGVSYRQTSFVDVSMRVADGRISLRCDNSRHPSNDVPSKPGGVGLANLRQRLHLLYGNDFNFDITEDDSRFLVNLSIPCKYEQQNDQMHSGR